MEKILQRWQKVIITIIVVLIVYILPLIVAILRD